jgi:hypothetical protein
VKLPLFADNSFFDRDDSHCHHATCFNPTIREATSRSSRNLSIQTAPPFACGLPFRDSWRPHPESIGLRTWSLRVSTASRRLGCDHLPCIARSQPATQENCPDRQRLCLQEESFLSSVQSAIKPACIVVLDVISASGYVSKVTYPPNLQHIAHITRPTRDHV